MKTIRWRLIAGLLCATVLCTAGAGVMLYKSLQEEANEVADLQLRQLAVALPDEYAPDSGRPAPEDPEEQYAIQAWNHQGALVYAAPLAPYPQLGRHDVRGFTTLHSNGVEWRVYGSDRRGRYVQVAQPMDIRNALAAQMAVRSGAPLLIFVVVLTALTLLVARSALRPLNRLASIVSDRSPSTMEKLPVNGWPAELAPVVHALNAFLGKFAHALTTQRTFVADAAHELRTPLTALKLQLQLIERETDDTARAAAMARLGDRLDRSSHLVHQLLDLAGHETGYSAAQISVINLEDLLERTVADFLPLAESRDIDLGLVMRDKLQLEAHSEGVQLLLNNLIDNALRYTQRGGRVDVTAHAEPGQVVLGVSDNGPGIAPEHRKRVFDRFYRPEGNEATGCGLGLSIVSNIAQHHHARISLSDGIGGRGLTVQISFAQGSRPF